MRRKVAVVTDSDSGTGYARTLPRALEVTAVDPAGAVADLAEDFVPGGIHLAELVVLA